jgi:hypothetical protein
MMRLNPKLCSYLRGFMIDPRFGDTSGGRKTSEDSMKKVIRVMTEIDDGLLKDVIKYTNWERESTNQLDQTEHPIPKLFDYVVNDENVTLSKRMMNANHGLDQFLRKHIKQKYPSTTREGNDRMTAIERAMHVM